MNTSTLIASFRQETEAIATAARQGVQVPLPSCPGWTMSSLLAHLGVIYISIARNIQEGDGKDIVNELADLQLNPTYYTWFDSGRKTEDAPEDLVDWFEAKATRLAGVFEVVHPAQLAWTWFEPDQTVGFWMRRMAHETIIHRWDAQRAYGEPDGFDNDMAADGIDEVLQVYGPTICRPESTVQGRGESYHFHRTDGPGEWTVRFEGTGMDVTCEHAKGDVAIRGAASDLLLFLWHRIPADRLEVLGDSSLVDWYFELVPPD